MDEDPASLTAGAVALYKESGVFTYDDQFVFLKASNRLGVGASDPIFALDVRAGNVGVSGDVITSGSIYTAYGGNIVCSGGISARTVSQFGSDVTISGNLYVKGTTAYIDSTNITVQDKQLELASVSGNDLTSGGIDSFVDDGGVVIRSSGTGAVDTGDKKWTWKNASNTWTAATSNGENLGITSSGIIFNAGMGTVSGAYKAGSGLTLLNNDLTFAIGNMFKVGAISSGYVNPTLAYTTHQIHQGTEIGFSGVRGLAVGISGIATTASGGIIFDPSELSGILQYGIDNTTGSSALVNASGDKLLVKINASGAFVSGLLDTAISGVSGYFNTRIGALGGGYSNWFHTVNGVATSIGSTSAVSISGVSGIVIDGGSITRFSAAPLSGVLMHRIQVSGTDLVNASGAFVSGIAKTAIAAVSGYALDVSGYFNTRLGGLGGGYSNWKLTTGLEAADAISSTQTVIVSGISGVATEYVPGTNHLMINAVALSGNLQHEINSSGQASVNLVSASGAAVSGIAKNAIAALSGVAIGSLSVNALTYGSGLVKTGNNITTDVNGSGQLSHLFFKDHRIRIGNHNGFDSDGSGMSNSLGSGAIVIGELAGYNSILSNHTIMVGSGAGASASGHNYGILIGSNAGSGDPSTPSGVPLDGGGGSLEVIAIGTRAFTQSHSQDYSIIIGADAGGEIPSGFGVDSNIIIGRNAGYAISGAIGSQNTFIGHGAGSGSRHSDENIGIGVRSLSEYYGPVSGKTENDLHVAIGTDSMTHASGLFRCIALGDQALSYASGDSSSGPYSADQIAIGHQAASYSFNDNRNISIGRAAGYKSSGMASAVNIGTFAGMNAVADHGYGINIGQYAGYGSNVNQSMILIGRSAGRYAGSSASGVTPDGYNVGIGDGVLQSSSGITFSLAIGYLAGSYRNGMTNGSTSAASSNIMIGTNAGRYGRGSSNTFIGYGAGSEQELSKAIVIKNGGDSTSNTTWINSGVPEEYTVSLGRGFYQAKEDAVTQIGKAPTSITDFDSSILRLANYSTSKVGLKTTMYSSTQISDQIQASTDANDWANTIVNSEGFLEVPVALSDNALSGASKKLYTHAGSTDAKYEIARQEGTMCIHSDSGVYRLAVYLDGQWKRMPDVFTAW